jgi:hypothetical protein
MAIYSSRLNKMTAFSETELNVWNLARQHWTAAIHLFKGKAESRDLRRLNIGDSDTVMLTEVRTQGMLIQVRHWTQVVMAMTRSYGWTISMLTAGENQYNRGWHRTKGQVGRTWRQTQPMLTQVEQTISNADTVEANHRQCWHRWECLYSGSITFFIFYFVHRKEIK